MAERCALAISCLWQRPLVLLAVIASIAATFANVPERSCQSLAGTQPASLGFLCAVGRSYLLLHICSLSFGVTVQRGANVKLPSNPAAHPEPLKQRSLWHPLSRRPGGRER